MPVLICWFPSSPPQEEFLQCLGKTANLVGNVLRFAEPMSNCRSQR